MIEDNIFHLFFYSIFLNFLVYFLLILGLVVFLLKRRHRKSHPSQDKEWYLQIALSREDAVSQLFLLLSFFFLYITLLAFNRDFSEPLSGRAILFITSVVGLIGAYYLKTIYTLAFSLIGLVSWWEVQAIQWFDGKNIAISVLFIGLFFLSLFFYSLGHLHEKQRKFKRFALVYLIFGILVVTGALFFFSTELGLDMIEKITKGASFFNSWQLTLSLFIFFISAIGTTVYAVMQKLLFPFEMLAVFILTCLFGIIVLLPEQTLFVQNKLSSTGVLWAIVFNLAIFFELLGLIFSGYLRQETWIINVGTLFLFLLIFFKYFDWLFTSLDKSIFFIGAGILLFVVGWFMEKGRRYIISNIKAQSQQIQQ